MVFRGELFVGILLVIIRSVRLQCSPDGEVSTFSRWSGVSPERAAPVFVYAARGDEPSLTAACLARCRDLHDCAAVSLLFGRGYCYGFVPSSDTYLRVDNDATYFEKICLKLPSSCSSRWWTVETTPGYHLHAEGRHLKVVLNTTARECYDAVLSVSDQPQLYRSAQWVVSGEDFDAALIRKSDDLIGNCILNTESKYTEPESYRVANYHTLYIENQCRHDYPEKIDRCSYEEYHNQTLKHIELTVSKQTRDECKTACEVEQRFVCRGFTWRQRDVESSSGECLLHSEDLLTVGSWLLRKTSNAVYYRRVICLNITVECTNEELEMVYRPRGSFRGRVVVPGRGERCSAKSVDGMVRLRLPLHGDCDVNFAHAITNGPEGLINRTMAYAMVMIQNNPIIQTAGDRWVRVGCSPAVFPPQRVHAAVTVTQYANPSLLSEASLEVTSETGASAVFNNSGWTHPPLTMYIVRVDDRDSPDTAVSLGEMLELRIETTDENEIEVYHLVASSRLGDSSVLLLDSQGCPTGQVDFPAFSRTWLNKVQRLWARFKAFRFPTSHVVRFAIMVRFCDGTCVPRNCGKGRITREALGANSNSEDVTAAVREESGWQLTSGGVLAQSGGRPCADIRASRVPLELELVVGARDVLSADTLVRADHSANIPDEVKKAGTAIANEGALVCVHELVAVSLALCWLAVQLILLAGCCLLVKRYRNLAEMNMQKDYQSFDNVGFENTSTHRRVHWPDQVDMIHTN